MPSRGQLSFSSNFKIREIFLISKYSLKSVTNLSVDIFCTQISLLKPRETMYHLLEKKLCLIFAVISINTCRSAAAIAVDK